VKPLAGTCTGGRADILAEKTAQARLHVAARAAEPVVKIEVADRGVDVVPAQQADDATAMPYAFRIGGRPAELTRGFGEVGLVLLALVHLSLFLIGRLLIAAALRKGAAAQDARRQDETCREEERGQATGSGEEHRFSALFLDDVIVTLHRNRSAIRRPFDHPMLKRAQVQAFV
jgi:hypothetical protein